MRIYQKNESLAIDDLEKLKFLVPYLLCKCINMYPVVRIFNILVLYLEVSAKYRESKEH